jgi:hypothetical protein
MPVDPALPANRDEEESELFALPRALTFAGLGAYILGLFIVNLDLAKHGIWDVELARPQYILAGVLWAVMNGLAVAWLLVALSTIGFVFKNFHPEFQPWHRAPVTVFKLLLRLLALAVVEVVVFYVLVRGPLFAALGLQSASWVVIFDYLIQGINTGFAVMFLFLEASRHRILHSFPIIGRVLKRTSGDPAKTDSSGWAVFLGLGILLLVLSVSLYTYSLFPLFGKIIGGGRPPNVRLILDRPLPAPWPSHIWVSPDGRRVGPVALLLESATMVIVGPVDQPMTWNSSPGEPAPAVEINKNLVSMVLNEWRPYMDEVLVTGGLDADNLPTRQANFFSSSDGWSSGANFSNESGIMADARAGFTATDIPEGDSIFILVAGGADQSNHAKPTAESYQDYKVGSSHFVGFMPLHANSMSVARMDHSATLMPDQDVLIAGGRNDTGPLASAELFHTDAHTFNPTGSMLTPRFHHAATALAAPAGPLAGSVLITGGVGTAGQELREAEIYVPSSGVFALTGPMTTARQGHTATVLNNGLVLIAGGSAAGEPLATAELFDPETQTFHVTGALHNARVDHTATLLDDGRVLIAGGRGPKGAIGQVEIYDPKQGMFLPSSSMMTPRAKHTATRLNDGSVLVAGGVDAAGHALASAEIFDPWTESFRPAGVMPIALSGAQAVLLHKGE